MVIVLMMLTACSSPRALSNRSGLVTLPADWANTGSVTQALPDHSRQALSDLFDQYLAGRGGWLIETGLPKNTIEHIRTAFTSNHTLMTTLIDLDNAQVQATQSRLSRLPSIQLFNRQEQQRFYKNSSQLTNLKQTQRRSGLDVTWSPDVFGVQNAAQRALTHQLGQAQLALELSQDAVTLEVISSLLNLHRERAKLQSTLSLVNSLQQTETVIRSRVLLGLSPKIDLDRARSNTAIFRATYEQSESQLDRLRRSFAMSMGAYSAHIDTTPNKFMALPALDDISVDSLLNRPDIQRALLDVHRHDALAAQAFRQRFPRFSFQAMFGSHRSQSGQSRGKPLDFKSLILDATAPLFQQGELRLTQTLKENEAYQAALRLQSLLLKVFHETASSIERHSKLDREITFHEQSLVAARSAANASLAAYQQGVLDYLALLTTQRSMV
jgi:outer membrane protein TolC